MLWIKSFHVISMVAWFAGLFYLPRLFVYHADAKDAPSNARFKIMEHRLYYGITTPAGLLTVFFGLWLLFLNHAAYSQMMWLHVKFVLVGLLILFHLYCGLIVRDFKKDRNQKSAKFYRIFNEFPTIILIFVVILSIVQPVL
jgi:putative membrane protein